MSELKVYVGDGKKHFQIIRKLESSNLSKEDVSLIVNEIERISLENQKANALLNGFSHYYDKMKLFLENNFK